MGNVIKGTCIICSVILAVPLVANIVLLIYGFNRYKSKCYVTMPDKDIWDQPIDDESTDEKVKDKESKDKESKDKEYANEKSSSDIFGYSED